MKPEDQEPEISGLDFYFEAFVELGTTRQVGMGVGPIPFTAIAEYFRIYQLEEEFEEFAYLMRRLDSVYLELNAAETDKKATAKGKAKSGAANSNKTNHHQG